MNQLTQLFERMEEGDNQGRAAFFAAASPELCQLARARPRDRGRKAGLDTSSLAHESYLRFVHWVRLRAEDRRAFFAYASQVTCSSIVTGVHERMAKKRSGDRGTERSVQCDWEKARLILAASLS